MPVEQVRNMLIIALCMVGFLIWQAWQQDYGPKPVPRQPAPQEQTTQQTGSEPGTVPDNTAGTADDADVATGPTAQDLPAAPGEVAPAASTTPAAQPAASVATNLVTVRTNLIEASIDPRGGNIVQLALLNYPVSVDRQDEPFLLLSSTLPDLAIAQAGLKPRANAQGVVPPAPDHTAIYTPQARRYVLEESDDTLEVRLDWQDDSGVQVAKVYTFHRGRYDIGVRFDVSNTGDEVFAASIYGQLERTQVEAEGGLFRTYTYTGGVFSTDEKPYEKYGFDDMFDADLLRDTRGGWAATIQHYFATAWLPSQELTNRIYSRTFKNNPNGPRYFMGLITPAVAVAPGSTGSTSLTFYAGPKTQEFLQPLAPHLERAVDYGWLWFIAEPLFWILTKIHAFIGNWGFSVIVLTILIKLAFFHLSATSYKSMARMRKMQPRIMALRERYSNDKQRMNQAMMELYKEEKVNPLGGCLPILVQIPVFIALYWVLLESVELRQAPFVGWIRDLSIHDPLFVLPVLMGITMFVQQKLNPTPPDPMQAKIMMALPFVFTVLFLFFPAGLVLYWFVNNLLSIAQQWVITRKIIGPDG